METPAREAVEVVDSEAPAKAPTASIQSVSLFEEEHRVRHLLSFPHIFGSSHVVDSTDEPPEVPDDYVLRPLSKPLGFVSVILDPVKEANLLLPERFDPFRSRKGTAGSDAEKEQARARRIKQQQLLLAGGPGQPFMAPDGKWHFQVQAGGSFRQGNNPSTNINTQLRAERHTLHSDFTSRFGAFYSEQVGGIPNRRIFGQGTYDRNLRGRWFAYVREDLEWDAVRLINIRALSSAGIGFRFVDTVRERLLARVGPTASYLDYDPKAQSVDQFRSGWLIEGDYRRVIGEASRFELTSSAYPDFNTQQAFRVRTEAAVLFPIGRTSTWNWKIGVRHEYILDPVANTKPNDIEGYFSIVYTK